MMSLQDVISGCHGKMSQKDLNSKMPRQDATAGFHSKQDVKAQCKSHVNLLMNSLSRESQYTVIFYILVWSEAALEIEFLKKAYVPGLTRTQKHVFDDE